MADDGSKENAIWPMPQFYFQVMWGSQEINFSEISGLDNEKQIIEYRHGNSKSFYPIKMPGIGKVNNVSMKRGVFVGDNTCLLYTSPSPRDLSTSRMPSSA